MDAAKLNYYILFDNYTQGLALHELLRSGGLRARIAPTPRTLEGSRPCGMSLLVKAEDIGAVRECMERRNAAYRDVVETPCQIDPGRGKFC